MKKYHQLILIITSIISVGLLLIYRHEYNRLRYVLEVFNFFGQPTDCSLPDFLNVSSVPQMDWGPTPVWTSQEEAAIYSAFLQNQNDAEALVVHDQDKFSFNHCYLWLEESNSKLIGSVKFSKVQKLYDNNNLCLFKYYCHVDAVPEAPYAVSFVKENAKHFQKIMLQPIAKKISSRFTTICVAPSETFSKQQIVEFISYHKIIGINSFIIYDQNIPYKFMQKLQKLSIKLGLGILVFPWNFPHSTAPKIRDIIEEDCLLRTKDRSEYVIILNWNELIVPRHHKTVSTMLNNYDPNNHADRFAMKVFTFCLTENDRRDPSILHSIYYFEENPEDTIFAHRSDSNDISLKNNVVNTQEIAKDLAAIHRYVPCVSKSSTFDKMDSVMLKFSSDMRKSTLFKLFKYDRL